MQVPSPEDAEEVSGFFGDYCVQPGFAGGLDCHHRGGGDSLESYQDRQGGDEIRGDGETTLPYAEGG